MNIFMGIVSCVLVFLLFFFIILFFRNEWVYMKRIDMSNTNYYLYNKLPSYYTMLLKFWIWDVNKFIKEENN